MQHEIFGAEWQHALIELMLQYKQYALIELMLQYKQYALKGQKLLAQGTALGLRISKNVALFYSN